MLALFQTNHSDEKIVTAETREEIKDTAAVGCAPGLGQRGDKNI